MDAKHNFKKIQKNQSKWVRRNTGKLWKRNVLDLFFSLLSFPFCQPSPFACQSNPTRVCAIPTRRRPYVRSWPTVWSTFSTAMVYWALLPGRLRFHWKAGDLFKWHWDNQKKTWHFKGMERAVYYSGCDICFISHSCSLIELIITFKNWICVLIESLWK